MSVQTRCDKRVAGSAADLGLQLYTETLRGVGCNKEGLGFKPYSPAGCNILLNLLASHCWLRTQAVMLSSACDCWPGLMSNVD